MPDNSEKTATGAPKYVMLKVVHDGVPIQFKMKRTMKMHRLMTAYFDRNNELFQPQRFLYKGKVFDEAESPNTLHMIDGDVLQVI